MFHFLKPGGSMIFNVAKNKNVNLDQLENQLKELFNNKFVSVDVRKYGAFHITLKNSTHRYNRLLLAYLMNFFSPLRTLFGFKKERIYVASKKN